MSIPNFDFGGEYMHWMQWIRDLRFEARKIGKYKELKAFEDSLLAVDKKGRPDRVVRFWAILREFWPEDYRRLAADAMLHNKVVPGLEKAPHPASLQYQEESEPEPEQPEEGAGEKPKAFRAKKEDKIDYSRWDGKKQDPSAGWDWVYNNIENFEVDPYSAPNAGDVALLNNLRRYPQMLQKFCTDYMTRKMANSTEADERRSRIMDTAEDLSDTYTDIQNRAAEAPEDVQNQIMGYARTMEATSA